MASGLNLYIINIDEDLATKIQNELNLIDINNEDNLEYINDEDILVFRDKKLYLNTKIRNQVVILINSQLQITNHEFLILDCNEDSITNERNFFNKENLFNTILNFNDNELSYFIIENKNHIENTWHLSELLQKNVDLNLIKIKLVSLWKF